MQLKNKGNWKQQKRLNLQKAEQQNQSKPFDPEMNNLYTCKHYLYNFCQLCITICRLRKVRANLQTWLSYTHRKESKCFKHKDVKVKLPMAKAEARRLLFSSYKEGSQKIEMIFVFIFDNSRNNDYQRV